MKLEKQQAPKVSDTATTAGPAWHKRPDGYQRTNGGDAMAKTDMPNLEDGCAECGHRFGAHFLTYDEAFLGCSGLDGEPGNAKPCKCSGFTVRLRVAPALPVRFEEVPA